MPRYIKPLFKVIVYFSLILIGFYWLLMTLGPFFAVKYAQQWYGEQHPGQSLVIDQVDVSLWHGTLMVKGVDIKQAEAGTIPQLATLGLQRFDLSWQPLALFQRSFLGNATLTGFSVSAQNTEQATLSALEFSNIHVNDALQVAGDITLSQLALKKENSPAVSLEKFQLSGLDVNQQHVTATAMVLNDLQIGENKLASLARYEVADIHVMLNEQLLQTGMHRYAGLIARLEKTADGNITGLAAAETHAEVSVETTDLTSEARDLIPEDIAVTEEPGPTEAEPNKSLDKSFSLVIAGLQQIKDQPSYFEFNDQQVSPAGDVRLAIKQLDAGKVDVIFRGDDVILQQPIPLKLNVNFDDYDDLSLTAELGLTNGEMGLTPEGTVELLIDHLDLVPFNGYVADATGYHILHGSLDLGVNLSINNEQMNGEARIFLRNSKFTPVDQETIDRLSKQVSMPLDTAFSILRDDNNNIRLNLPISGPLHDPDVGLNDLINQLSVLAVQEAVTYYLTQMLQPYTALISISSYAGDYLLAIRLDDLAFEPLQAELTKEHQEYLEKVAGMMAEKENLELKVCGFASEEEHKLLSEKPTDNMKNWQSLAKLREVNIQRWFHQQHQDLVKRVTPCHPQKGEKAVVSLGF